jgi:translation initiation factor 4A
MSFKSDPDYNETPEEVDTYDSSLYEINSWDELDIPPDLLRGIYNYGFENPSPIQKKAIKPINLKKDIIAQAQSGTGKTATFTIGALSNINTKDKDVQVMVLSPTRELSIQTANVFNAIGSMMDGLEVQILIGGNSIDEDIQNLKNKHPQIVVGCPGRVFDMIRRNTFNSRKVKLVILDEADEMFSSGFKEQVYNIFQSLHKDIQVALFSATIPSYIYPITEKLMRDPIRISVKAEQLTLEGISQYFVAVEDDRQKYNTLKELYSLISVSQCIIYCNSVKRVSDLYDAMIEDGFPVCCIHSSMDKVARDNAFMEFRNGKFRVLISSNVTARGIDIQQVSVVINFDICKCVHTYLHRIGRSGRWGRKGVGINLITRRDISKMKEIEAHYACEIKEMPNTIDSL